MNQEPFSSDPPALRKRNSAKAVVFENGRVLLTRNRDDMGVFYLLPGGGQRFGETLHRALVREVLEETGHRVVPDRLLLIREYVGANHQFAAHEADVHQVEHMFLAHVVERSTREPVNHDAWQTGFDWVQLDELDGLRIYPSVLVSILPKLASGEYQGPLYLGDVN